MAIEWVAERLISLLPIIGNVSKDKREVADKALYAISEALTETCLYVNKYVENGKRDEKIEAQLVRYWLMQQYLFVILIVNYHLYVNIKVNIGLIQVIGKIQIQMA